MKIIIKTVKGEKFDIQAEPETLISDLKAIIQSKI